MFKCGRIVFFLFYSFTFAKVIGYGPLSSNLNDPYSLAISSYGSYAGYIYVADTNHHRVQVFDNLGNFKFSFGTYGTNPGQFNFPKGIAINTINGRVAVSDTENHRIQIFEPDGTFVAVYGNYGSLKGQFKSPHGLCFDQSGKLYVADRDNNRIQVFDGVWKDLIRDNIVSAPESFFSPTSVFTYGDPSTPSSFHIFVVDTDIDPNSSYANKVKQYNNGTWKESPQGTLYLPTGVSTDGTNIYVSDYGNTRIAKCNTLSVDTGTWTSIISPTSGPFGIANDTYGNIYITQEGEHKVFKYNQSGALLLSFGTLSNSDGQFDQPYGIAVDNEKIYVVDSFNHRIQIFDINGNYSSKFGSYGSSSLQLNFPKGIAIDKDGKIYVADTYNHRIMIFNNSGTSLLRWIGNKKTGTGTPPPPSSGIGQSEFNFPKGVAIDNEGKIYVADTGNSRVQIFNQDGSFIKEFGNQGTANGEFLFPEGILVNKGKIYVVDTGNHRVQIFDSLGNFISKFGSFGNRNGEFNSPVSIAIDDYDYIYITDTNNNRIQVFKSDGTFLKSFGSAGGPNTYYQPISILTNSFYQQDEEKFSFPTGIFIKGADIFISDTANHRIQQLTGLYISGKVTDKDLNPLSGFIIEAIQNNEVKATTTTDINGNYTIYNLPTGVYELRVLAKAEFNLQTKQNIAISAGSPEKNINFILQKVNSVTISKAYCYPNPVRGNSVSFYYLTNVDAKVNIRIYSILGELVKKIEVPAHGGIESEISCDISNIDTGVYIYVIEAESEVIGKSEKIIKKLAIIK
jgi:sugar lactone lactonase YvrE